MSALLDASSVSVPFESLKRVTRERKYAVEEVEGMLKGLAAAAGGDRGDDDKGATVAQLDQYVQQLQGLKRKVGPQLLAWTQPASQLDLLNRWIFLLSAMHRGLVAKSPPRCLPMGLPRSWRPRRSRRTPTWHAAARAWRTCAAWAHRRATGRSPGTGGALTPCWWTTSCAAGTTGRRPRWRLRRASRWETGGGLARSTERHGPAARAAVCTCRLACPLWSWPSAVR